MIWLLFLALAILVWTSYDVLFKVVGSNTNYFLAVLIIGAFQILMALPFLAYAYFHGGLNYTAKEIYIPAIMGVLLGAGTVFFFYTFKLGAPLSIAMPVYGVGTVLVGALAGVLIFKEALTPMILAGMILGAIGIVLLTVKF